MIDVGFGVAAVTTNVVISCRWIWLVLFDYKKMLRSVCPGD